MKPGAVTTLFVTLLVLVAKPGNAQQSAVADSIRQQADKFIAALASKNIDQFVSLFTTDADFIYVDGGRIYPNPAALKSAGSGFFRSIKNFSATWNPAKTVVLGPDAGAFTGVMNVQAADTTGKAIWATGKIWTLVYQRRGGRWQILQAHEATVPAPRPAAR